MDISNTVWNGMAFLIFALSDFIIAELIALFINKTRHFKKSEYFVFGMMFTGITIFFISNIILNQAIKIIASLGLLTIPIFIIMFCSNVVVLAKIELERRWKFRLVLYPLLIIVFTLIVLLLYL